jgi:hypothetical protein
MVAKPWHIASAVLTIVMACAPSTHPAAPQQTAQGARTQLFRISVVEDSVLLFRSPKGASLRATIRIRNLSDRVFYFKRACGPTLQRQLGTKWETVWDNQNCLLVETPPKQLVPGDSANVFAQFWGSSGASSELAGWPPMDERVGPGVYRLVIQLGEGVSESGSSIARLLPIDERASEPFTVHEMRRP